MILDRLVCLLTGHQWQPVRRTGSQVVVCLRCGRLTYRDRPPGEDLRDDADGKD